MLRSRRGEGCDRVRWRKAVRDGIRGRTIIMEYGCAVFDGGREGESKAEAEAGSETESEAETETGEGRKGRGSWG